MYPVTFTSVSCFRCRIQSAYCMVRDCLKIKYKKLEILFGCSMFRTEPHCSGDSTKYTEFTYRRRTKRYCGVSCCWRSTGLSPAVPTVDKVHNSDYVQLYKQPTRCNKNNFMNNFNQLNMFRAIFRPSSGALDCLQLVV